MRRGEIPGQSWEHIDLDKKAVFLLTTNDASSNWVPLSDEAVANLSEASKDGESPFPFTDVAFRQE